MDLNKTTRIWLSTLILGTSTVFFGFHPSKTLSSKAFFDKLVLKNWGLKSELGLNHCSPSTSKISKTSLVLGKSSRSKKGSFFGTCTPSERADISATEAWQISTGSKDVVVAVIDTGIDPSHPDLKPNLWQKNAQTPSKPIYGWNFVSNVANPTDDHGHGTHVSGIIGAVANPKSGIAGVAQQVSIMPIKYYSESNSGIVNLKNTVQALHYAIDQGARIINYSGGGPEFSEEEYLAIKRAESKGILVVAAAGNEHQDTDRMENYYYPAAYRIPNIIAVAATDTQNRLIASSNWGKNRVDVAAPGSNIYSTLPGGRYGYMTGTSQATAFVSGVAALLLAQNPKLTPVELKKLIVQSVDTIPELQNKISSGGRVNAYQALMQLRGTKTMNTLVVENDMNREPPGFLQNLIPGIARSTSNK